MVITGLVDFFSKPEVHDSALVMMLLSSIYGALPKPGEPWSWGVPYKIFYKTFGSFLSLRTGQNPEVPTPPVPSPAPVK